MNSSPDILRKQLEESGEILKEKEDVQGQSDYDQEQTTDWDSLKEVPFRGEQVQDSSFQKEAESEEEEMGM